MPNNFQEDATLAACGGATVEGRLGIVDEMSPVQYEMSPFDAFTSDDSAGNDWDIESVAGRGDCIEGCVPCNGWFPQCAEDLIAETDAGEHG